MKYKILFSCFVLFLGIKAAIIFLQNAGFWDKALGEIVSPDKTKKITLIRETSDPANWIQYRYEISSTNLFAYPKIIGRCISSNYDAYKLKHWVNNQSFLVEAINPSNNLPKQYLVNIQKQNIPCDN